MKIVGCDLHARQQRIAMVDTETGEFTEKTLAHEGDMVREFYASLPGPVVVGIEATGAMQWFLELLEELGVECRVGHPAKIRAARDSDDPWEATQKRGRTPLSSSELLRTTETESRRSGRAVG
jgi:hypothetical protein